MSFYTAKLLIPHIISEQVTGIFAKQVKGYRHLKSQRMYGMVGLVQTIYSSGNKTIPQSISLVTSARKE